MSGRQKRETIQNGDKRAAAAMFICQRTLKEPVRCSGIGLHTGRRVSISLFPAPVDHGIVFHRTDIGDRDNRVPALWDKVVATRQCTVLGNEDGVTVATVEHLMAAFAGRRIDNALVAIDGGEAPIMDGSAAPFVFLLECAGAVEQEAPRRYLRVQQPIGVAEAGKSARLIPSSDISFVCEIEFDHPAIARQNFAIAMTDGIFKAQIARARTFGFLRELERLRVAGLAQGGSLSNAILLDDDRILNEEGLRYDNEFVRHKILDCIGDVALAGAPILARFEGIRCGHALNNKLLQTLFANPASWEWVNLPAFQPTDALLVA